jgi:hypothetical protein
MSAESAKTDISEFTNPNLEVLYSENQIQDRIAELGQQITREYKGLDLVLVGVLKGSCIFLADLMRVIDLQLTIDFMAVSSYKDGTVSTGDVEILKGPEQSHPRQTRDRCRRYRRHWSNALEASSDLRLTGRQLDKARNVSGQTRPENKDRAEDRLHRLRST